MSNVYMGLDVEDFIFSEGTVYEEIEPEVKEDPTDDDVEVEEAVTDEELNTFGVIECCDDPDVACYRIALENEMNYNAIMNAMMVREFNILAEGAEVVYEAKTVSEFFEVVKKAALKLWSKIQGVFKALIDKIGTYVASNKAFVKKYENADLVKPEGDKKFKGYSFKSLNRATVYGAVKNKIDDLIDINSIGKMDEDEANTMVEKFEEKFENAKDNMRKVATDNASDVTKDNFNEKLKEAFYGSKEKVDLTLPEFKELINNMKSISKYSDEAKAAYKENKKVIQDIIKDIKKAESNLVKAEGRKNAGMKIANCYVKAVNATLTIMNQILSVHSHAILSKAFQDRAMAAFYVANQPKPSKVEESAMNDLNVVLI